VRSLLGQFNEVWARQDHASIPNLLKGQVLERIRRQRIRATRINDDGAVQICRRAAASTHELATLMRDAYVVRVTADYEPDIRVVPDEQGRFRLNSVPVTAAHDWPVRAREHGLRIIRALHLADE